MKLRTIPFDKLRASKLPIRQAQGKQNDQGIAIIISVIILNLILVGTLVISKIFTGEIINSRILYNSTAAYYAAESGIEYALFRNNKIKGGIISSGPCLETNELNESKKFNIKELRCETNVTVKVNDKKEQDINIKSTGFYKSKEGDAKRKIEINIKTTPTPQP